MNPERMLRRFVLLIFALAAPLLLTAGSARLLLSHEFLRLAYARPGFPADPYGFTTADRFELSSHAINYLFNGRDIGFLADLRLPAEKCAPPPADGRDCPMFKRAELVHMRDVKAITSAIFRASLLVLILCAILAIWLRRRDASLRLARRGVATGCALTLVSLAALGSMAAMAWDRAFDGFHALLFAAGSWRFPFSDSLIRLYPERLFVDAALALALLMSLGAGLILLIIWRIERVIAS